MFHEKIKALFSSAVDSVASTISKYSVHPDKDFTRQKKLPPDKLITFLVSQGSSVSASKDGVVHFPAIPVILMKII